MVGTDTFDVNISLMPDDTTAIAAGALVSAEYIDVAAGAAATARELAEAIFWISIVCCIIWLAG